MSLDRPKDDDTPAAHNASVREALIEYTHFPHPQGFAVMLTGRWGSGKTSFIKSLGNDLSPVTQGGQQAPIYISLYGRTSPDEIAQELFVQLHPLLGHNVTRLAGAVLRGAAKMALRVDLPHGMQISTGSLPELGWSSLLGSSKGRVLIFDDFERAQMQPAELLGYINPFVEHDDCKVIVVADETRIRDEQDYKIRKEKTIGRRFSLRVNVTEAFSRFLEMVDDV